MDNNLITVATFQLPSQMHVMKSKLESEGIKCYVKDELTVQVHNFYSNAIGGVKLQVHKNDYQNAKLILQNAGVEFPEIKSETPKFLKKIDSVTSKIPFIKKMQVEARLIVIFLSLLLISLLPFAIAQMPSDIQLMAETDWCVDYINYEGKKYRPNTVHSDGLVMISSDCFERINFQYIGEVFLPGFESAEIIGSWEEVDNKIKIFDCSNFANVYEGVYELDVDSRNMVLNSEKTTIYCFKNDPYNNW